MKKTLYSTLCFTLAMILLDASHATAQVSVVLEIDDPGDQYASYHEDIERVFLAAAEEWTDNISGSGTLEIEVYFQSNGNALMFAGASIGVYSGTHGGSDVYQWGTISEIITGEDPNGSDVDGSIGINPDLLDIMWFDPNPGSSNPDVPSHLYDAYSIVLHEYGHILAFNGWLIPDGSSAAPIPFVGDAPSGVVRPRIHKCGNPSCLPKETMPDAGAWVPMSGFYSTFDILMEEDADGGLTFVGPNTLALFADGVPFDPESYTHVFLPGTVMYTYAFQGVRDRVTDTELAILTDCGVPVSSSTSCITGTDSDGDGVDNCDDLCPNNADLTVPGDCGCEPCSGGGGGGGAGGDGGTDGTGGDGSSGDTDGDGTSDDGTTADGSSGDTGDGTTGDGGSDGSGSDGDDEDEVVLGDQPEIPPTAGPSCGVGIVGSEMMLLAIGTLMVIRRRRW